MSENINTNVSFGQKTGDEEEEPIIVAQRFLNIFRQLHIFSNERREAFNQMILELPISIRNMFKTLPGGSVLNDYVVELENAHSIKRDESDVAESTLEKPKTNILQNAISENQAQQVTVPGVAHAGIIDSGNFAKILASSLAQSNAQIIRELQNNRPTGDAKRVSASPDSGPLKLIADETFTQTIASALAEAMANSEQKRQEDNKIIAQSFLELQENLNKMVEQNAQLKIISSSDAPAEAASAFQLKNVVDDLVKAQSKFLKETTQSQKEELSSIISVAIKESLKLSTQSLIDSFKKMEGENGPAPITYAASSPKNNIGNVEEALKAQGKEFSSIIASALRESQQNSAQAIIKTIEGLKSSGAGNGNSPKVEDIMKMQAELFRDIARAQNQEFSNLISSALQESQKQSTQAIIAALGQMQGRPVAYSPAPQPLPNAFWPTPAPTQPETFEPQESTPSFEPAPIATPDIDYSIDETYDDAVVENDGNSKKKKKKKKKNRNNGGVDTIATENTYDDQTPILAKPLPKQKTIISALPEMPVIEDKVQDSAADWGFGSSDNYGASNSSVDDVSEYAEADNNFSASDNGDNQEWNWEYQDEGNGYSAETASNNDETDSDWEWEYEEVPEGEEIDGTEGEDWEWDYEEIPEDESTQADFEDPEAHLPPYQEDIIESSQIIIPDNFELLLIGMEDKNYQDPYLENNDNIG